MHKELAQRIENVILLKLGKILRNFTMLLIILFTDIELRGIKSYFFIALLQLTIINEIVSTRKDYLIYVYIVDDA